MVLLVGINAKYIHTTLAVRSLQANAGKYRKDVEIAEYTINHRREEIFQDIYRRKPEAVGFSCYLWNIEYVMGLAGDLKKVLPNLFLFFGGPEVSYHPEEVLAKYEYADLVMVGEGERTFQEFMAYLVDGDREISSIDGIVYRDIGGLHRTKPRQGLDMDDLVYPYDDMETLKNRIIYYESMRGCPFSCSYCLSSIEKSVRIKSPEKTERELDFFLENKVPQVKFVDRTFNCRHEHAMEIWKFLIEHDNGVTNFHFEISADLLTDEEIALIGQMRPGLIQLEIGVQSTNDATITEIHRTMQLDRLKAVVRSIQEKENIHEHLDLIAGLPYEGYETFARSFDEIYALKPNQLQLGFLKVLKGSYMYEHATEYGLIYRSRPPYEVLKTNWLGFGEILRIRQVEEMLEVYYNSGQFTRTLKYLEDWWKDAFVLYEQLADYYEQRGLTGLNHSRLARYEILHDFVEERTEGEFLMGAEDALMCDLYLRENAKSRPPFALDQSPYKEKIRSLTPELRGLGTRVHAEVLRSGKIMLFDYRKRDPLTHNAEMICLEPEKACLEETTC